MRIIWRLCRHINFIYNRFTLKEQERLHYANRRVWCLICRSYKKFHLTNLACVVNSNTHGIN